VEPEHMDFGPVLQAKNSLKRRSRKSGPG